jgi:restriction system protein
MQWTMNENSLFAILLRSGFWWSFLIAGCTIGIMVALLPEPYRLAGVIAGLPFVVTGCMAAWRQWKAPSRKRIESTATQVRTMPWPDFSRALIEAYRRDGYEVQPIDGAAADLEIRKEWRRSLVSCKRWKVARTGIEPLRELVRAKEAREAHGCVYVAVGEITDNAREYAVKHSVTLVGPPELARLLGRAGLGSPGQPAKLKPHAH